MLFYIFIFPNRIKYYFYYILFFSLYVLLRTYKFPLQGVRDLLQSLTNQDNIYHFMTVTYKYFIAILDRDQFSV